MLKPQIKNFSNFLVQPYNPITTSPLGQNGQEIPASASIPPSGGFCFQMNPGKILGEVFTILFTAWSNPACSALELEVEGRNTQAP